MSGDIETITPGENDLASWESYSGTVKHLQMFSDLVCEFNDHLCTFDQP